MKKELQMPGEYASAYNLPLPHTALRDILNGRVLDFKWERIGHWLRCYTPHHPDDIAKYLLNLWEQRRVLRARPAGLSPAQGQTKTGAAGIGASGEVN